MSNLIQQIMGNILSAMFDYRVKKHGYICAAAFFIIDLSIRISGIKYLNEYSDHLFFQYLVMLGLLTIVGSKDKEDDERLVQIRYYVFKTSLSLTVVVFGVLSLVLSIMDIEKLTTVTIIYCIEGLLIMHLLLYSLAKKYNPKWLFREDTAPKDYNNLMIGLCMVCFLL